jgi:hypothetical protein
MLGEHSLKIRGNSGAIPLTSAIATNHSNGLVGPQAGYPQQD